MGIPGLVINKPIDIKLRNLFENKGGNLGATNCVAWMFHKRGQFLLAAEKVDEDALTNLAIEAGAEDVARGAERAKDGIAANR